VTGSTQPQPSQQPPQRFEIEISPDVEPGVHSDFTSIWHTPDTFVLDFASLRQPPYIREDAETGGQFIVAPTRIVARVKIPPAQVFELMKGLEQQLSEWEVQTGQRPPNDPPLPNLG